MQSKVVICGVDTNAIKRIDSKESKELLKRIKEGSEVARQKFITGNIKLVLSIIKRFSGKKGNSEDMFQVGCVGLIKAVDNFDINVGVQFSTYAVPMIIGEIKRYLREGNSLRVSRSIRDRAYQVLKAKEEIKLEKKEEASVSEIAERLQVAVSEVAYALDAISDTVSLYEPVYNKQGDTLLLMDQIGDERNTDEVWTEKVAIQKALSNLDEREKKILLLRYYEGKTQTEISNEVGISQAQVSRLEKTVLKRMKEYVE